MLGTNTIIGPDMKFYYVLFSSKGELGERPSWVPLVATARQYFRLRSGINEHLILRGNGWRKCIALIAMSNIVTF
jgi:hypothetical protein